MQGLERLDRWRWRVVKTGGMRVEGLVYADGELLEGIVRDGAVDQLRGVARLPGVLEPAIAMPDAHQGYGFPIGGVAAFDAEEGVICPGGVGYDINCGVRLIRSKLGIEDLGAGRLERLVDGLAAGIPAGVGSGGGMKLSGRELKRVLERGAEWVVAQGMGSEGDLEFCEDGGRMELADWAAVSERARERGRQQLGTLGGGNHFIEVGVVEKVFDGGVADAFGLWEGQVVFWIHSGSRGLGHQVCDDYLRKLASDPQAVRPADRQLISAPLSTMAAVAYQGAMAAAANFAFANRQVLTHRLREIVAGVLGVGPGRLGLGLVYDVAHNIAKLEEVVSGGKVVQAWVHRKGATRALGPGNGLLPTRYQGVGQPVLVPGDMGTASYVLVGGTGAEEESFASAAHGAGRVLSRHQAKRRGSGRDVAGELAGRGVVVRCRRRASLLEEMPEAYKDVERVVEVMVGAGLVGLVARTRPIGVVKG